MPARLVSTGMYVPKNVFSSAELEERVNTSQEWVVRRTGIHERRLASQDSAECASFFGIKAGEGAIRNGCIDPSEIDCVISTTNTPDYPIPATSCLIQSGLSLPNSAAFDLQSGCCGFIYALDFAAQQINSGNMRYILVIAPEIFSRFTDWSDRSTCVLFGDGAGAFLLGPANEGEKKASGIISSYLRSNGSLASYIEISAGGCINPASIDSVQSNQHKIKMNGKAVYRWAIQAFRASLEGIQEKTQWSMDEIDWIIPHQANHRIHEKIAHDMGLPEDKFVSNIASYGNTSTASIPMAFHELFMAGKIKRGQKVVLVGFGAGLSYGALAVVV